MTTEVKYHIVKIGDIDYKVCSECDTVHLCNFECPNCRRSMRKRAGEYMNSILDAVDERQGVSSKLNLLGVATNGM